MTRESATAALVIGAVILLVGLFLFMGQSDKIGQCQTFIGQLGAAFSPDVQQQCDTARTLRTLGGLGMAGGAIVALVGIVKMAASPKES